MKEAGKIAEGTSVVWCRVGGKNELFTYRKKFPVLVPNHVICQNFSSGTCRNEEKALRLPAATEDHRPRLDMQVLTVLQFSGEKNTDLIKKPPGQASNQAPGLQAPLKGFSEMIYGAW